MRHLIASAVALALVSPAFACINDTELKSHEREFKSQYQETQYEPPTAESTTSVRPYVIGGTGVLFAVAGIGAFLRLRPRA
ncbi:MAG TPA: hypothetical protein VHR66_22025 [Gemmataceae bacterium]|jgi:hypothetical protein|nr:hypothetical protein [Gemmataceae bacterium]